MGKLLSKCNDLKYDLSTEKGYNFNTPWAKILIEKIGNQKELTLLKALYNKT